MKYISRENIFLLSADEWTIFNVGDFLMDPSNIELNITSQLYVALSMELSAFSPRAI